MNNDIRKEEDRKLEALDPEKARPLHAGFNLSTGQDPAVFSLGFLRHKADQRRRQVGELAKEADDLEAIAEWFGRNRSIVPEKVVHALWKVLSRLT